MDPLTHALASYALKRAAFPRLARPATLAMIVAGTVADLDSLSKYAGPSAFLTFYRTYSHSFLIAIVFALLLLIPFRFRKLPSTGKQSSLSMVFVAALATAVLHLLLDLFQSVGVELFWPFSTRRFALDWVAPLDIWILGILLAGILLPMLSGLVTEEIGARSKGSRGKVGATLAFAALILYIALRAILHDNVLAVMEARTYRGDTPRKVAAFADSSSPFRWHGVAETESALHEVEVGVGPALSFDPDSAITSYKPESSPALDAARNSAVAQRFLQAARFSKATVEKTPEGYHVILRDFPYARDASFGPRVEALIDTGPSGTILSEELVWVPASRDFWWQ